MEVVVLQSVYGGLIGYGGQANANYFQVIDTIIESNGNYVGGGMGYNIGISGSTRRLILWLYI